MCQQHPAQEYRARHLRHVLHGKGKLATSAPTTLLSRYAPLTLSLPPPLRPSPHAPSTLTLTLCLCSLSTSSAPPCSCRATGIRKRLTKLSSPSPPSGSFLLHSQWTGPVGTRNVMMMMNVGTVPSPSHLQHCWPPRHSLRHVALLSSAILAIFFLDSCHFLPDKRSSAATAALLITLTPSQLSAALSACAAPSSVLIVARSDMFVLSTLASASNPAPS